MAEDINLGDNFQIDEDSNGDLVIRDTTSGIVAAKYDRSADSWTFNDSIATDDLVDGAGISHTGRIADLGELFLASYESSVGNGSVTNNSGVVEIREPGNASSSEESRIYSHILEFDPSKAGKITVNIQNITIDDNSATLMIVVLSDTPDVEGVGGDDLLAARVGGSGTVTARTEENGTNSESSDSSQNNAYIASLDLIELDWDGSSLTVRTDDGSTEITVTDSGNYPSGETLHLHIGGRDGDGANARNVDFDIDSVVVDQ